MNKSTANLIIKSHVHATVQHDVASSHTDQDAASAHICYCLSGNQKILQFIHEQRERERLRVRVRLRLTLISNYT